MPKKGAKKGRGRGRGRGDRSSAVVGSVKGEAAQQVERSKEETEKSVQSEVKPSPFDEECLADRGTSDASLVVRMTTLQLSDRHRATDTSQEYTQPQNPQPSESQQVQLPKRAWQHESQLAQPEGSEQAQPPMESHRAVQQDKTPEELQKQPQPSAIQAKIEHPAGARPRETKSPKKAEEPQVVSAVQLVATNTAQQDLSLPKRPSYGTKGRKIQLYSNHFRVKFPDIVIYQYDLSFRPEKLAKKKRRDLFEAMQEKHQEVFHVKCVFDGKTCMYSPKKLDLPNNHLELDVSVNYDDINRPLNAKVAIKHVADINLMELQQYLDGKINYTPYVAIQAMDIVMRHGPSLRFTPIGRSLFCNPRPEDHFSLGGGLELHKGFFQSMRPSSWKPFKMSVNIDVSNTAFYKPGPVIDFMAEVLEIRQYDIGKPLRDAERKKFEKGIKGLQIEVRRDPSYKRKFRVIGVTQYAAERQTFPLEENGRTVNCPVAKYFLDTYNLRLRYSRLPCLHVGQPDKKTFIPLEMCHIVPNQHCRKMLSSSQTSAMIKKTAIPAPERLKEIKNWIQAADHKNDPNLKSFGLVIDPNLIAIPGRVLQPPAIKYKEESLAMPREGSWDMRQKTFHEPIRVKLWGIICFENVRFCNEGALQNMESVLRNVSKKIGMPCEHSSFCVYKNPTNEFDYKKEFEKYIEEFPGLQLVFIVLPGKGNDIYGDIKKAGDASVGIATQNIKASNATKASPRTMENICLKINAKLGGTNNIISPKSSSPVMKSPVLILGADVTHPSPGDFHRPSIAAVVGSMDKYAIKYCAKFRVQEHRKEIIEDLDVMVKELLINFYKCLNVKPQKIIMYRDGVSEGQFEQVLNNELMAIRRACTLLSENYKPGITFITVQKRHHTRLFCTNPKDEQGRGGNVPAGTIVDSDITHPVNWDFYLCSHAGIQGTSRPAHYYVLWDDNNFTQDQLEEFTNQMCYTYVRCTRSTSIPSPAYYAHHVAFRARDILYSDLKDSDSGSTFSSGDRPKLSSEELERMNKAVQIHLNQTHRMYYA